MAGLAAELALARERLAQARELERRRIATALAGVTGERLSALRAHLAATARALSSGGDAAAALAGARAGLDELLDRFRVIARGVHPAVLRTHGLFAALDELVADLPRPVLLTGRSAARWDWEIESGLYHPAAAVVTELAGRPGPVPLRVHLAPGAGRLGVRVEDPAPERAVDRMRAGLRDEAQRLAALGGDLEIVDRAGAVVVRAWVPDRLEPAVPQARPGEGGVCQAARRDHAAAVAAIRRAAVAEMDSERRAVERDLHDGAQHHLVGLRLALGMVEHEVATGRLDQARDRLALLTEQVALAEVVLAEAASGVLPRVLVRDGLAAALRTELGEGVRVDVEDRRFAPEVEAAVYFCCLEAVGNARKHAPRATVCVQVWCAGGVLGFLVSDDGPGFVVEDAAPGRGLANIAARIAAVGGAARVRSCPGAGTTVSGTVPLMPV